MGCSFLIAPSFMGCSYLISPSFLGCPFFSFLYRLFISARLLSPYTRFGSYGSMNYIWSMRKRPLLIIDHILPVTNANISHITINTYSENVSGHNAENWFTQVPLKSQRNVQMLFLCEHLLSHPDFWCGPCCSSF
jgi:hypothetical protein